MKKVERQYFGPAKAVAVLPTPETEKQFLPEEGVSVDLDFLSGFSEPEVHSYIRLKHILAQLPMPEVPVEEMDRVERVLKCLFEILKDGKVNLQDWQNFFDLAMEVVAVINENKKA